MENFENIGERSVGFCSGCGAQFFEGQKFCHNCGKKSEASCCEKCGKAVSSDSLYCPWCGACIGKKVTEAQSSVAKKKKTAGDIVKRSAVLLVSILLLVMAFLPIGKISASTMGYKIDMRVSAFDSVVFFFDTLDDMLTSEIEDSAIYEELEELATELEDEYSNDWQDGEELDELEPVVKLTLRMVLKSNAIDFRSDYLVTAVISIIYIAVAVVLFVFSVLSFIALFVKRMPDFSKLCVSLLALEPIIALTTVIAFSLTYYALQVSANDVKASAGVCAAPIIIIAASVVLLAVFALWRIIEEKPKASAKGIVFRSLSAAFSLALMLLAFAPVMTTTAEANFKGRVEPVEGTVGIRGSFFGELNLSEYIVEEEYDIRSDDMVLSALKSNFSKLSKYTKNGYENGKADMINHLLLADFIVGFGAYEFSWVFGLGNVFMILCVAGSGLILWQNLLAVAIGISPKKRWTVTAKIISAASAVIVLALVIVIISIAGFNIDWAKDIEYSVNVSWATIASVVIAAACAALPMRKFAPCTELAAAETLAEEAPIEPSADEA